MTLLLSTLGLAALVLLRGYLAHRDRRTAKPTDTTPGDPR